MDEATLQIKPTVGRVVWYRPDDGDLRVMTLVPTERFFRADVCAVQDSLPIGWAVNLTVNDSLGVVRFFASAPLFQGDAADCPPGHACWMPYQRAQAGKHQQEKDALHAVQKDEFTEAVRVETLRAMELRNDAAELEIAIAAMELPEDHPFRVRIEFQPED